MKRGNLQVAFDNALKKWVIQGRKANGVWYNAFDVDREKQGLSKDLVFDLKYDACGWLQSFIDFYSEQTPIREMVKRKFAPLKAIQKRREKNKSARKSRKINRKKK